MEPLGLKYEAVAKTGCLRLAPRVSESPQTAMLADPTLQPAEKMFLLFVANLVLL